MRVFISLSVTGIGMGFAVWIKRRQRWLKKLEHKVKAALPEVVNTLPGIHVGSKGSGPLAPCAEIQDLPTLQRVVEGPECLSWAGSHVTSLVVRDAGPDLPFIHPLVGQMTSLVTLDMSHSTVHYLPYFVSSLVSLQTMSFSSCQLNFVPMEVGALSSLTSLDLSRNQLPLLPNALCSLTSLTALNAMGNQLIELPQDIGSLTALRILGLKSNLLTTLPDSFTRLSSLVELFITDNKLVTLPTGFGSLTSLVKLQASFNSFTSLPPDLVNLPHLELMRVAVCSLAALPPDLTHTPPSQATDQLVQDGLAAPDGGVWLNGASMAEGSAGIVGLPSSSGVLPRLAWFSLSGNGACAPLPAPRPGLQHFQLSDLVGGACGDKLGDGASGEVRRATLTTTGEQVAVKIFRADVSPDGRTEEEVGIACAVDHPNLTQVIGVIPSHSEAVSSSHPAPVPAPPLLVMRLVTGQPMAAKPTSEHLLRCKWAPGTEFTLGQCVSVAEGVAAGLEHLHQHCICHGDVYAHNILVDSKTMHATLCDFGASFCYHPMESFWQSMEVRAYGLFLKDVVDRLVGATVSDVTALGALVDQCTQSPPSQRPTFTGIRLALHASRLQLS